MKKASLVVARIDEIEGRHREIALGLASEVTTALLPDAARWALTKAAIKPEAAANDIQTPGIAGLFVTWIK
jgi:hypothetical protein